MSEEFFSGFRKDIKNKFVSADSITESEKALTVEKQYDPRPLYQRLKEQQAQKDAEMDEAYRLANRIRKLDEDEVVFLEKLSREAIELNKTIKDQEKTELNKFKADAELIWKTPVTVNQPIRKFQDPQKKLLESCVVLKKDSASMKKPAKVTKKTATPKKTLVPMYPSDSD